MVTIEPASEPRVLAALARLADDDDFRVVLGWIAEERQRQLEDNTQEMDDRLLRQGQGAGIAISTILATAQGAREALRQMHRPREI